MEKIQKPSDVILSRFIGSEKEILRFLKETEERYNIRLYPSVPSIDTRYPNSVRVYCHIPIDRPPVKKEVAED